MPEDGVFHATTITIANGASLHFNKNARNTPVYLLATGDVVIDGWIDLTGERGNLSTPGNPAEGGKGGPGGYDGGAGWVTGKGAAGSGLGPGGGQAGEEDQLPGDAAHGDTGNDNGRPKGAIYGTELLIPLVGGSGGGGTKVRSAGYSGGGGGGALLIASDTVIKIDGSIYSNGEGGGGNDAGYGSGGAIRLVAPKVEGNGGLECSSRQSYGGLGRIRIDTVDTSAMELSTIGVATNGANLVVFPPNLPELTIVEAAGQVIDPESLAPVTVLLPDGTPSTQTVKIEARNFDGTAKVNVVLTPNFAERVIYPLDISNPGPGSSTATVNVEIPSGVLTRIDVWTR